MIADAMGRSGAIQEGMEGSPGGGSDDTHQDQGMAADIFRTFDGAVAGKPKAAFSNWQVGLP